MNASAPIDDPRLCSSSLVVREAQSQGWNECVPDRRMRDTLHEERALGRFHGEP